MFKAANNYDILDPETQAKIMECREEKLGFFTKLLRFTDYKRMTPFEVTIRATDGSVVVQVVRGVSIFLSSVRVLDGQGQLVGGFKQKFFSIGGKFDVLDAHDQVVCTLQGKWTGWDFRFKTPDGYELAHVTKKWAGLGKELFTSADNYVLEIAEGLPADDYRRLLIVGAVMCIDMVLKE
jgi:uncharacterized protein YxjI